MAAKKPLIFVHPLSESLQKLKEVIEEIAEDEKIEIYELDQQAEINQLIPTIGQSLTIFSHPKKCAMTLQPNRKVISKLNSKVILLSKKQIPRKTLDKFSKIGLTECITEPVAPKTLLYKVKLLLRSIVVQEKEENEEYDTKFSSEENEDTNKQQRVEKGIKSDEENVIDMTLQGKIQNLELSADESDDSDEKEKYQEGAIEKDWKGKVNNTDLQMDDEDDSKEDKDEESENYIDSYLRGKRSKIDDLSFDEDEKVKKESHEEDFYDDQDSSKKKQTGLDLSIESDIYAKDNEEKDSITNDDKYYKSKTEGLNLDLDHEREEYSSLKDEIEEEIKNERKKESFDISLDADNQSTQEEDEELEDIYGHDKKKSTSNLDLEADEDNQYDSDEELGPGEEEKKNSEASQTLDLEADKRKSENESHSLDLEQDTKNQEEDDEDQESTSSHWKGKVAKTIDLVDEEEIDARNRDDLDALDANKDDKNKDHEDSLDLSAEEDEDSTHQKETNLDLDNSNESDEDDLYGDIERDKEERVASTELDLESDQDSNKDDDDEQYNMDHDSDYHGNKKDLNLDFDSDDDVNNEDDNHHGEENYNRRSSGTELELEDDYGNKKHSAHTEKIDTKMDSRKGIKHQEYDWDIAGKKDKEEHPDEEKKIKSEMEISFAEKIDLGEQTIDYRKLKNEFDAITINRVGNKRKRKGPKYTSGEDGKEFLKGVYQGEYEEGASAIAENMTESYEDHEDKYFEPKSNGIESAVRVMNLYANKNTKKENIFQFISQEINNQFGGKTFFFTFSNEKNVYELSHAFNFDENDKQSIDFWNSFQEEYKAFWDEHLLPHWHDENFSTDKNQFYYPLTEGKLKFGYAVCIFDKQVPQTEIKTVEVIIETMRGVVLSDYRELGLKGDYQGGEVKAETKESGGFFKKVLSIFKRAS